MNSFISWIGGKKLLRKSIIELFPKNIGRYIEVFGGAGWVLFGAEKHAALEIYNDADGNLVNLFKCVKYHADELRRTILPLNSRELFYDIREREKLQGRTDIQRAADFFMLIRTSFGADRTSFGCNKKSINHGLDLLSEAQNRLQSVVIENKGFQDLIKVYDRKDALFYCDPPYYGAEKFYSLNFNEQSHRDLLNLLSNIKGRFILSYNDCPFIRELYKEFNISTIERSNNLSNKSENKRYKELIITNY